MGQSDVEWSKGTFEITEPFFRPIGALYLKAFFCHLDTPALQMPVQPMEPQDNGKHKEDPENGPESTELSSELDIYTYHEKHAGRLVLDPEYGSLRLIGASADQSV